MAIIVVLIVSARGAARGARMCSCGCCRCVIVDQIVLQLIRDQIIGNDGRSSSILSVAQWTKCLAILNSQQRGGAPEEREWVGGEKESR